MGQLHVMFFPFLAHGHMIPILDMAKLFASRGVKTTIITTPMNVHVFTKTIEGTKHSNNPIALRVIKFPAVDVGLPEEFENAEHITSETLIPKFLKAARMLQEPLEHLLRESHPNCLVADMFFPWSTEIAAKFNIPRLVFHGHSFFALCTSVSMKEYKPFENISSDSEPFIVPNLPGKIELTRTQVPLYEREEIEAFKDFNNLQIQLIESEKTSYGVVVNSFYELEPEYACHYRKVLKRRAWHMGPLSLCNKEIEDKTERGKKSAIDEHECLKWLGSKKPNSVIYVCFGSMANFGASQLYEVAMGLEASGKDFIWSVLRVKNEKGNEQWLPAGFEERMDGKGLIIRGWAPQVLILDHEAIGGFVTHCGWNSVLEGVCGGVPMVTWPCMNDQFYNEKLVTKVLRIGVPVGAQQWNATDIDAVKRDRIEKAVKRIMVGEEAEEMRKRAKELKEMAKKAVAEGGSSYSDLNSLLEELASYGC